MLNIGDIFGEEDLMLKNKKRQFSIKCLSDNSELLRFKDIDFTSHILSNKIAKQNVKMKLKEKLDALNNRQQAITESL